VVVLATELSEELIAEGLAREIVRAIQDRRKEMGCEYTDRIVVGVATESKELRAAIQMFSEYIRNETLTVELVWGSIPDAEPIDLKLAGHQLTLYVKVVSKSP